MRVLSPSVIVPRLSQVFFGSSSNFKYPSAIQLGRITLIPVRNAGHSKWANIRHTKEAKDLERSKELNKVLNRINLAIREGGSPDPKLNSRLNSVIQEAKDNKLPLSSIQRVLEKASKSKTEGHSEVWAAKGPAKSILLIEIFTENRKKLKDDLNLVFKKNRGLWTENAALHQFEHIGLIHCKEFNGKPVGEEHVEPATEHAIDVGADDVSLIDDPDRGSVLEFSVAPLAFTEVKFKLKQAGYTVVYSETIYVPTNPMEVTEEDYKKIMMLYQKVMENPEVVNVHMNVL